MIHLASERRSSVGPLVTLLVLRGLPILLLWALVRIVSHLSIVVACIGVAWSATLDWGIVGHSLTWCLIASLMLLGAMLILVAKLLWILRTLLVRVSLGILTSVPLVGWPLVSLWKTLLWESSRASVATRRLSLELPLLKVHFLTLVIYHNSTIHQFLETGILVGHQLQLESIIQSLQKTTLFVRIPSHLSGGISR
jgi:hypothetical protein